MSIQGSGRILVILCALTMFFPEVGRAETAVIRGSCFEENPAFRQKFGLEKGAGDEAKVSEKDRQFCETRFQSAKKNFQEKKFAEALEDLKQIFRFVPNHPEAHYMKAILEAKRKNFPEAWRDVEFAEKKLAADPKFKEFVDRLQKASSRPGDKPPSVTPKPTPKPTSPPPPASEPIAVPPSPAPNGPAPTFADEMVLDIAERFFADKAMVAFFTEGSGEVELKMKLETLVEDGNFQGRITAISAEKPVDKEPLQKRLKDSLGGAELKNAIVSEDNKSVVFSLGMKELPAENPAPKIMAEMSPMVKEKAEKANILVEEVADQRPGVVVFRAEASDMRELNAFVRSLSAGAVNFAVDELRFQQKEGKIPVKANLSFWYKTE